MLRYKSKARGNKLSVNKTILPNRKTYSLHHFDNLATIADTNGWQLENTEHMRSIAASILAAADSIDKFRETNKDKSISAFRQRHAQSEIDKLLGMDVSWNFYNKEEPIDKTFFPCVYFAVSDTDFAESIKIGYTSKPLPTRMKQLVKMYKLTSIPYPIAAVKLSSIEATQDLEYWLHIYFSSRRIMSEWFSYDPVKWFLSFRRSMLLEPINSMT